MVQLGDREKVVITLRNAHSFGGVRAKERKKEMKRGKERREEKTRKEKNEYN